ncbi:SDR family NAD(P)-dependent oxidoreductase [Actinophytocola sp.]|uniref:SDR family NAD(P)-dependent oxidoreductase n=1 Tax=Actinophytocola sp. TaxID=1872138 RepID=UPI002D803DDD|nr:SDR family oxidoreductase [Actinophytocola sp.]HET9141718.1 SDR family oxidoreductase [Actinophytocola sp.]
MAGPPQPPGAVRQEPHPADPGGAPRDEGRARRADHPDRLGDDRDRPAGAGRTTSPPNPRSSGSPGCWARELGPHNITVNLVAPGWIPVERHVGATAEELAAYRTDVPLARFGTPHDVAATVAFLASDNAAFLTGQCLPVNGGRTFTR